MPPINSIKKEVMNGAFCSFERKSNLDFMDSIPSFAEEDIKDLLPFSIPNIFPSIIFTNPFLMALNPMPKFIIIICKSF
jgi:hypothetical protein